MSAKRWFIMLICAALIVTASIALINICIDPFGVFGDDFMKWYSYDMTNNPKVAKFSYIDSRRGEYDAFVIGPSGASSLSPALLEKYTGLRWYNAFNYGADMEYTKRLAAYLIENHNPKQILLCVPIISASAYGETDTDIAYSQPLKAYWRMPFYFANPKYSMEKIKNYYGKSYLQQSFDVFNAENGTYNKSRRDAEAISTLDGYLETYPAFRGISGEVKLEYTDECVAAVAEIKALCESAGTELIVTTCPMLIEERVGYNYEDVKNFYEKLAEVSDFWDFTISAISRDPRYFYDTTHFRNSVGEMLVARIFGDDGIYIPDDLGVLVTPENAATAAWVEPAAESHTKEIPIITYHHIAEEGDSSVAVSPSRFEEQMRTLYEEGYSAVSLTEIRDYVVKGADLPEKPIIITFDDGYMSNYDYAYPILKQYNFKATIFAIGISFGKDTYKETGEPIIPHFGEMEAREMVQSGLISIQSHTYDMHQTEDYDFPFREGVLRMNGESEGDYIAALYEDYARFEELLKTTTGEQLFAISYPRGLSDELSSIALHDRGISISFSIENGIGTLVKGLPQSLLGMKRMNVSGQMTGQELIKMIER